jgi:hypothetical protein
MNLVSLVIMKRFVICYSHQIYKWPNREGDERSIQHTWEERDLHTNSLSGNPRVRERFEDDDYLGG